MPTLCRMRALCLGLSLTLFHSAVQSQETDSASGLRLSPETAAGIVETLSATPAAIDQDSIRPVEHNILHRPIELSDEFTHWADRSYPYGSTQLGARAVHLGVEFVNPRNTPVYAAKTGVVAFAGNDFDTLIGPQLEYYGLVVIVAHPIASLAGRQVFTLYGHLESISVEVGQSVDDSDAAGAYWFKRRGDWPAPALRGARRRPL